MAEIEGKKISGVPERTELTGNELYPFADSGSQGHVKGSVLKAYCATPIGEAEGTAFDGARGKAVENKLSEGFIINHYLDNNLSNGNEIVLTRIGVSGENGEKYYAQDTIPSATTTKAGVMSANDKKNLDNVAGLYYIPYASDEWEQKIKDAAGNSRGVYINCANNIPLLGYAFKNDNVYGHAGGGLIMASESEMEIYAYAMPNLDNPDEYYNASILLNVGGDGSKFLGDDGEYHSVGESANAPVVVNLDKYHNGTEDIVSEPGFEQLILADDFNLESFKNEIQLLATVGGVAIFLGKSWYCSIGEGYAAPSSAREMRSTYASVISLYSIDVSPSPEALTVSNPIVTSVTLCLMSDGTIKLTDPRSSFFTYEINNVCYNITYDIGNDASGEYDYLDTIIDSDFDYILKKAAYGNLFVIGHNDSGYSFFYPVKYSYDSITLMSATTVNGTITTIKLVLDEESGRANVSVTTETLSDTYATKEALATKQDALVSGTNIKTVNGQSILGEGDINIEVPEGGITDAPSDGSTYGRNNGAWIKVEMPDVSGFITETEADGKYATPALVDSKVAALVNSAPATLDTLKELADALGNDASFSTTITTKLGEKVDKTTYESDKAGFATKTELANKLDTSTYNSDKDGFATKTELNNKKNITIVQEVADASSSVSFNLDPNTLKKIGEVGTITVLGFTTTGLQSNELAEYAFEFKSGDTPTVLTMPESVKWIGDHTIEANKTYQVSIVNNLAVMGGA